MRNLPRKLTIVSLLAIGLVAVKFLFFRAPSEAQMLAHFQAHSGEFEQLLALFQEDKQIHVLGRDWMERRVGEMTTAPEQVGLSNQRPEKYHALMAKLGVAPLVRFKGRDNYIQFHVFGGGFGDTTWSIGYAWSAKPPENIVPSAYYSVPLPLSHSRIEGNWYIFHRR